LKKRGERHSVWFGERMGFKGRMKTRWAVLVFLFLACAGAVVPESPAADATLSVVDETGAVSEADKEILSAKLSEIREHTGVDVGIIFSPGHHSPSLRDYAYVQLSLRAGADERPMGLLAIDLEKEQTYFVVNQAAVPKLALGMAEWASENVFREMVRKAEPGKDAIAVVSLVENLLAASNRGSPLAGVPKVTPKTDVGYILLALIIAGFLVYRLAARKGTEDERRHR